MPSASHTTTEFLNTVPCDVSINPASFFRIDLGYGGVRPNVTLCVCHVGSHATHLSRTFAHDFISVSFLSPVLVAQLKSAASKTVTSLGVDLYFQYAMNFGFGYIVTKISARSGPPCSFK